MTGDPPSFPLPTQDPICPLGHSPLSLCPSSIVHVTKCSYLSKQKTSWTPELLKAILGRAAKNLSRIGIQSPDTWGVSDGPIFTWWCTSPAIFHLMIPVCCPDPTTVALQYHWVTTPKLKITSLVIDLASNLLMITRYK